MRDYGSTGYYEVDSRVHIPTSKSIAILARYDTYNRHASKTERQVATPRYASVLSGCLGTHSNAAIVFV